MTEKPKCSKCRINDATRSGVTLKVSEEERTLYDGFVCESCADELLKCQECKTREMATETTKNDGSKVYVCEECGKKIQEVKQSIQKSKKLKKELEKYLVFGDHKLTDGTVIRGATCEIKKDLTKEQLLAFKKLLEDNMTGEPSPTNGGQWLG